MDILWDRCSCKGTVGRDRRKRARGTQQSPCRDTSGSVMLACGRGDGQEGFHGGVEAGHITALIGVANYYMV